MYRTKTLNEIINIIGKELWHIAKKKGFRKTTYGIYDECYVLTEYDETRERDGEEYTAHVELFVDGAGVKYKSSTDTHHVSYSYGSIPKLIEAMDDLRLNSPAANALRDYFNAYDKMKKIAWGNK